jgi:hypothetical protein
MVFWYICIQMGTGDNEDFPTCVSVRLPPEDLGFFQRTGKPDRHEGRRTTDPCGKKGGSVPGKPTQGLDLRRGSVIVPDPEEMWICRKNPIVGRGGIQNPCPGKRTSA